MMIRKIVSGGQTGPDRAALDFALAYGFDCGGWCPKGRLAEDGHIPLKYPLLEMPTPGYAERTIKNVQDSDGTLIILLPPEPDKGTLLTLETCEKHKKPCYSIVLDDKIPSSISSVRDWAAANRIQVLNIAGPRERNAPGIQDKASMFLKLLFAV